MVKDPATHARRLVRQELLEGRDLVLVAADHEELEAFGPVEVVQQRGDPAEVPLGDLLRLVVDAVLLEAAPAAVVGLAERGLVLQSLLLGDLTLVADLTRVELPQPRRLPVHDHDAGGVELVEHRQQGPDPGCRVHLDPVAHPARQLDLLVEVAPAAGEDRHRSRLRAIPGHLGLDALQVPAQREPCLAVEGGVLGDRTDLVEQARDPGGLGPQIPPIRIEPEIHRHHGQVSTVEPGEAIDRLSCDHLRLSSPVVSLCEPPTAPGLGPGDSSSQVAVSRSTP